MNPHWLSDCWRALVALVPDVRLVVAGEAVQPEVEKAFVQAVAQNGGADASAIEWRGYVSRHELDKLYRSASCAIFPAEETALMQAKCSAKIASALLFGLPVVASAVGEQTNYGAEGAARLVAAGASPGRFAAAVAEVVGDPTLQRELSHIARQRLLSAYNWGRLGTELSAFYWEVMRARSP
ncbi:MAG: glycosyltransferase [Caldilineaceae bacterium]|nr:glycosyltransferase [Caldilineaceae bacterium]